MKMSSLAACVMFAACPAAMGQIQDWVFPLPPPGTSGWNDFHTILTFPLPGQPDPPPMPSVLWADSDIGGHNSLPDPGEWTGIRGPVGGNGSTILTTDWTFNSQFGDWVNVCARFNPPLPAGTTVTGYYTRNGTQIGGIITATTPSPAGALLLGLSSGWLALRRERRTHE